MGICSYYLRANHRQEAKTPKSSLPTGEHLQCQNSQEDFGSLKSVNFEETVQEPEVVELQYSDGTFYVGQVLNGLRHGAGRLTFPDGSYYQGEFENDCLHGFGTLRSPQGKQYMGEWWNNAMHGRGVFTYPDGRKYEGEYKNNLKDGYGEYEMKDGRVYRGLWKKGQMDGEAEIEENGVTRRALFQNGYRVRWADE